jgi:hypothetical protein
MNNHEWCMKRDNIYRKCFLLENIKMVPCYYKDIEKKAFDGNLIAIKYLIYLDNKEKEKTIKQNLFRYYLELPIKEEMYRQVGMPPIETGSLRMSFKEIKEGDLLIL